MLKVLSSILCDLDPKVKAIGQKAGICDGVPSTSALVIVIRHASSRPCCLTDQFYFSFFVDGHLRNIPVTFAYN